MDTEQKIDKSEQRLDRIAIALQKWVEGFEAEKVQFLHRLNENPTAALERSTSLMFLSTRADVAKRLLASIAVRRQDTTAKNIIAAITETYQREALDAARFPRRSTNPVSDYIAVERGRTAVEVCDLVQSA